jgi:hypothetical protein
MSPGRFAVSIANVVALNLMPVPSMAELTREELEALADEIRPPRPKGARLRNVEHTMDDSKVRTGRPPALSRREEWELYCYRKSGLSIKTCASMWRVSVPTANRIIAKFSDYEAHVEPIAREFRDMIKTIGDSTLS